jgi:hypothetical protein
MLIIYYGDCNLPVLLIALNKGRKLPKHVLELSVYCEKRTYSMRIVNTGLVVLTGFIASTAALSCSSSNLSWSIRFPGVYKSR